MWLPLVAEDRSPAGIRDQTDRTPACSRLAHETSRHRSERGGTATSGEGEDQGR